MFTTVSTCSAQHVKLIRWETPIVFIRQSVGISLTIKIGIFDRYSMTQGQADGQKDQRRLKPTAPSERRPRSRYIPLLWDGNEIFAY